MGPRDKEIYVSSQIKRWLFFILQVEKEKSRDVTIDSIAERLLTEKIEQDYPNMKSLVKRLDALQGQLVFELLTNEETRKEQK